MLAWSPLSAHLFTVGAWFVRALLRRSDPISTGDGEVVDLAGQIRALLDPRSAVACGLRWQDGGRPAVIMDRDVVQLRIRPSDEVARVA